MAIQITPEAKRKVQLALLAAIALAALRTGYVLYQRHTEKTEQSTKQATALNPDYYVTPKKLYAYDLKSAHQLTQQPVWVKEGYRYTYYPYDAPRHHADFSHEAGELLPLEKLQIRDVATNVSPGSSSQKQIIAVFEKQGMSYAVPIGSVREGNYQIYSDEMLFIQDPHELYKHWPAHIWSSIDQHEVKPGMNEIQTAFAIGMGIPERSDDPASKTVKYPNGGKPLTVTYQNGRAVDIKPASSG